MMFPENPSSFETLANMPEKKLDGAKKQDAPVVKKGASRTGLLMGWGSLAAVGMVSVLWVFLYGMPDKADVIHENIGKGMPLPGAVSGATVDVGGEVGTLVALDGVTSTADVAVVPATRQPVRVLTDAEGLRLGTVLSLMTQAYVNGGPLARSLANTAYDMAKSAQGEHAPLAEALMVLRQATPLAGPVTTLALVAEQQRVLVLGAPAGLPEEAAPEASKSWWRRQLEKFVTIRNGEEPSVNSWTRHMLLVGQQMARNNGSDALTTLKQQPLSEDGRLDNLRGLLREYLEQQGRMVNAVNAYVNGYLKMPEVDNELK